MKYQEVYRTLNEGMKKEAGILRSLGKEIVKRTPGYVRVAPIRRGVFQGLNTEAFRNMLASGALKGNKKALKGLPKAITTVQGTGSNVTAPLEGLTSLQRTEWPAIADAIMKGQKSKSVLNNLGNRIKQLPENSPQWIATHNKFKSVPFYFRTNAGGISVGRADRHWGRKPWQETVNDWKVTSLMRPPSAQDSFLRRILARLGITFD